MNTIKIRVPVPALEPRGSVAAGLVVDGLMRLARWAGAALQRRRRVAANRRPHLA